MPKISYITPTNAKRTDFLMQAGRSLYNQTMKDIEWVIISPVSLGSFETTLRNELSNFDIKIIVGEDDKKVSLARNIGIKASIGEYIAFLDDDDLKYPNWGITLLNTIGNNVAAACNMDVIDKDGNIIGEHIFVMSTFGGIWTNRGLYFVNELLIPRNILLEIGMFDDNMRTSEDYELFVRIFKRGLISLISQKLCAYRKTPESMSNNDEVRGDPTHKSIH